MPPLPSDAEPRPPADFAPLLATKEPLLLVGGQAVNLWALYYKDRTADLAPFVSRDADILGDRDTLVALGKLAGTKPQFFPLKPPSNEVGVVIGKAPGTTEIRKRRNWITSANDSALESTGVKSIVPATSWLNR